MNISLPEDLEQYIMKKMQGGHYDSPADVIRDGLQLLKDSDALRELRQLELRQGIQKGFDSVARGEFTDYGRDEIRPIADAIKSEGRRKKAAALEAAE